MEKYINIKQLYQCETCSHHLSGKCDTWCECGESYRPAMVLLNIVEAEEVKHGFWEYNRHQAPHEKSYFCSLCAEGESDYGMDKYCSRCGARMDGKKEEE